MRKNKKKKKNWIEDYNSMTIYDAVENMTWWLRKLYFGFYLLPS